MFVCYEKGSGPGIYMVSDEIGRFLGQIYADDLYAMISGPAFTEDEIPYYAVEKEELHKYLLQNGNTTTTHRRDL